MTDFYPQQQWLYIKRPTQQVNLSHYQFVEQPLAPELNENEVLIQGRYFSVDPYMRIQQSAQQNWEAPHPLNQVQGGAVVAQVLQSHSPLYQKDDWVLSYSGWQTHAIVHQSELTTIDQSVQDKTAYLGVLGMPGRTAWFGLTEAGKPKPGDTLVVSGAAGAVGSLVCQFGIKAGCRVIAIAGSSEKCDWLKQLGVDHTINYKTIQHYQQLSEQLSQLGGVDIYFDNVGGMITDAILDSLNLRARVIICGQISQYSGHLDTPELGPRLLHKILYQRATIQGILARDFTHRMPEMLAAVLPWYEQNTLQFKTTLVEGFSQLPTALSSLFDGYNTGKLIVKS